MAAIKIVGEPTAFRNFIVKSLSRAGHRLQCLDPGFAGTSAVTAGRPDLVLLDLYSDQFDSYELLLKLKQDNPRLPVLIYAIKSTDSLYRLNQCIQKALSERCRGTSGGRERRPALGALTLSRAIGTRDLATHASAMAQPA